MDQDYKGFFDSAVVRLLVTAPSTNFESWFVGQSLTGRADAARLPAPTSFTCYCAQGHRLPII